MDQGQDQTLLSARFNGSTGSRCTLGQGGRGVEVVPQLCFAGCDTASVRALRTLMSHNGHDQPHLAPHLWAKELYLSPAQGLRLFLSCAGGVLGSRAATAVSGRGAISPDLNLLTVFLAWCRRCPITMDLPGAPGPDPSPEG